MVTKYKLYCQYRDARKITDYEVSKNTGVATSTLTMWKQKEYTPKIDKLSVICEYLEIPIQDMINAPDDRKIKQ